jgi:hypothetical protein
MITLILIHTYILIKKKECVEFRQKVARMLTMRELRSKSMEFGNKVRMMESQEKPLEVCRVYPIVNRPPKLILSKPSCANKENHNVTLYNYGYIANVKTHAPLF